MAYPFGEGLSRSFQSEEKKAAVQQRHKDQKLASIKERLLQNRSRERFTNYDNVCFDQNLTDTEKIIAYQRCY